MKIVSSSSIDTIQVAKRLSRYLRKGDCVVLEGPLGSGKTVFAKGIASGMGFDPDQVTSSSFVLMQQYKTKRMDIYHLDFYRIKSMIDLHGIGYEEVFSSKGLTIVEWPDIIEGFLSEDHIVVKIKTISPTKRSIDIDSKNKRIKKILTRLAK